MQAADVEQELSAIPDLTARYHRWLHLIQTATAQSQTIPTSDQDSEEAAYLWQYPTTLTDLEPQAQLQWQHDAQARFDLHEKRSEFDEATGIQKRKLACKNRIRESWGIEVEDILREHLVTGAGGLGRSTLEILATIAEESELDQVESVLKDVITERIGTQPHVGRSRKQKLTRQDVMEIRTRLKKVLKDTELGTGDLANVTVTGRRKRKRKRAASSVNSMARSKDGTGTPRRSTAPPADLPTPGASHDSDSSHGLNDADVTAATPEIGRRRQESLPDSDESSDEDPLTMDQSDISTQNFNLTPKGQDSSLDRLLQDEDPSQLPSDDSLDLGFNGPGSTTGLFDTSIPPRPFALERLSTPDISTMPLQEADKEIRKLSQAQFTLFFHNLKAIQELQLCNITRADTEFARIKGLLNDKDGEAADCRAKLEQASQALDAAEAEQHNADAECAKHESLRALCQNNDFSSAVRLALTHAEEELERVEQRAQDASEATEAACAEMQCYEDTAQQHQQALDTLRQELRAAERVRDGCKSTGSVLRGSSDEVMSLSLGPRFPHNDVM